ncbi:MAG: argininosuccinate lyase [Candidatus Methanospirare jalkutatii]|nr:argininosuccinate lyase [Candidatus Methanospirare jalkutatii]
MEGEISDFLKSLEADRWIFNADILVDEAHVVMLAEQGILKREDARAILAALGDLKRRSDEFLEKELPRHEDVHTAIEATLIKRLGEDVGGRMHTARSRNDEVATCIRIALRDELIGVAKALLALRRTLLLRARQEIETLMPGYTHLQHAQPTTLAHHLIAHHDAFARDFERICDAFKRVNRSPLGAAALAGTGFPVSRERTATLLGFDGIIENTMDAVSARDFIVEVISCFANVMLNASRLAEELILWSSAEFKFVRLPDTLTSGSSIMPQKRNPDFAELVRAKAGTVFGCLTAVLCILKALPFSYNRDLQEATPHLLNAVRTTLSSVEVLTKMLEGCEFIRERMAEEAEKGGTFATEVADTLVRERGIAFRTAHRIVASSVAASLQEGTEAGTEVEEESMREALRAKMAEFGLSDTAAEEALDVRKNVERRKTRGGPAREEILRALKSREEDLLKDEREVERMEAKIRESLEGLEREVEKWMH